MELLVAAPHTITGLVVAADNAFHSPRRLSAGNAAVALSVLLGLYSLLFGLEVTLVVL